MGGFDNAPCPYFGNDCLKGFAVLNEKIGCFVVFLVGSLGFFILDEKVRIFPVDVGVVVELLDQLFKFFCCGQPQGSFDNPLNDVFLAFILAIQC